MKKFLLVVFLSTLSTIASATKGPMKSGWIDMQLSLTSVKEGKRLLAKFEKEVATNKKELEKEQIDLHTLKNDFDKKSLVMNEKTKREKQIELQTKFMKLQEKIARYQQELQIKQTKASRKVVDKITRIVADYAAKHGYSYIYEKTALIYRPEGDNITKEIISLYNKKYK